MEIAVFIILGATVAALWTVYRLGQKTADEMEEILCNLSQELLDQKERIDTLEALTKHAAEETAALRKKLGEYEKAYGTAEEFRATINTELEKQARLEKEWTEGVNNILAYNVKATGVNSNE